MNPVDLLRWAALLLLGACTLNQGPNPTPVLVTVTQGITTCGDVIQAALEQPYCDTSQGDTICYALAEYNPTDPGNNVISRGVIGPLTEVDVVRSLPGRNNRLEDGTHWESYTLYTQQDGTSLRLITLDATTLAGISPALDALTLQTETSAECESAPSPGLLVQATDNPASLTVNGVRVDVEGTALLQANDENALQISTLDALTVISAAGVSRVVRAGETARVPLDDNNNPAAPLPAIALASGTLANLPPSVLPASSDANNNASGPARAGDTCQPRPGWEATHTVQRGENLARIAPQYDVTIQELQAANCLQNPNRLSIGQELRVPGVATPPPADITSTQPPTTAAPTATPDPTDSVLQISPASRITNGECVTLQWSLPTATTVTLNGDTVPTTATRQACPDVTTVYTLQARYADNTQETFTRSVIIRAP